jgi:hypothetical protein
VSKNKRASYDHSLINTTKVRVFGANEGENLGWTICGSGKIVKKLLLPIVSVSLF